MNISDLLNIVETQLRDLSKLDTPDFRLEQAEKNKEDDIWEIVISYLVPNTNKKTSGLGGALSSIGSFEFARLYKKVKINKDGDVIGIYIYNE